MTADSIPTRLRDGLQQRTAPERRWRGAKYIGLALLTSFSHALWLSQGAFYFRDLMSWDVTVAWLVNLITMAASIPLILFVFARNRHLITNRALTIGAPIATSAAALALCFNPDWGGLADAVFYLSSAILALLEVTLWSLWAECTACARSRYSLGHVGTTFGLTFILTFALILVIPDPLLPVFIASLPMLSGLFLWNTLRCAGTEFPALLPRSAASAAKPNIRVVSSVAFAATAACTFLCGIIPSYSAIASTGLLSGMMTGGLILLVLAAVYKLSDKRLGIFQLFPWVIIAGIAAYGLYLFSPQTLVPASMLALGCPLIFQVLLVVYFGKLASKGYFPPTITFAISIVVTFAGFVLGDGLSLIYEAMPAQDSAQLIHGTCLLCMLVLACSLIPLTRQEFLLTKLMSDPVPKDRVELICDELAAEYKLSPRETEVLKLLAQGCSSNKIAERCVISLNTVNTHIKHIYDKIAIHNRAELIDFVNMRNTEDPERP